MTPLPISSHRRKRRIVVTVAVLMLGLGWWKWLHVEVQPKGPSEDDWRKFVNDVVGARPVIDLSRLQNGTYEHALAFRLTVATCRRKFNIERAAIQTISSLYHLLTRQQPDARIIGSWSLQDSYGTVYSVREFKDEGTVVFTNVRSKSQSCSRYSIDGDVIQVGGLVCTTSPLASPLRSAASWLYWVTRLDWSPVAETYVILSSTSDTLVIREGKPIGDVEPFTFTLDRIAR